MMRFHLDSVPRSARTMLTVSQVREIVMAQLATAEGVTVVSCIAGEVLGGHRVVTLTGTPQAVYADASNAQHFGRLVGITTHAALAGESVAVQVVGKMTEPLWSWDLSRPVFLGATGQLTQTPPVTGFVLVVGMPITAQSLFINPQPPVMRA